MKQLQILGLLLRTVLKIILMYGVLFIHQIHHQLVIYQGCLLHIPTLLITNIGQVIG